MDKTNEERSIPTSVGKPDASLRAFQGRKVYPHKRGETCYLVIFLCQLEGLSPQAWGNLYSFTADKIKVGSIPTSVGKPSGLANCRIRVRVYPHKRGETSRLWEARNPTTGLSPQAWGNLQNG